MDGTSSSSAASGVADSAAKSSVTSPLPAASGVLDTTIGVLADVDGIDISWISESSSLSFSVSKNFAKTS